MRWSLRRSWPSSSDDLSRRGRRRKRSIVRSLALALTLTMGLPLLALAGTPEQFATCPRCGYSCEVGWRYCPACGWDLRRLAGPEGAATLHGIGTSVVGLSLVQETPVESGS